MIKTPQQIFSQIEQLAKEHRFDVAVQMPEEQQEWFYNIANIIGNKIIPNAKLDHLVYDEATGNRLQRYIDSLVAAVSSNDTAAFHAICAEILHHGMIEHREKAEKCSDCSDHDPACIPVYVNMLWWVALKCIPKPMECIIKHAALSVERDRIYLGHCDAEGGEQCKCFPVSWPLSSLLLLISVVLFFFSGPVIGTAGRELIRQTIARIAAVGAA